MLCIRLVAEDPVVLIPAAMNMLYLIKYTSVVRKSLSEALKVTESDAEEQV